MNTAKPPSSQFFFVVRDAARSLRLQKSSQAVQVADIRRGSHPAAGAVWARLLDQHTSCVATLVGVLHVGIVAQILSQDLIRGVREHSRRVFHFDLVLRKDGRLRIVRFLEELRCVLAIGAIIEEPGHQYPVISNPLVKRIKVLVVAQFYPRRGRGRRRQQRAQEHEICHVATTHRSRKPTQ